MGPLTLTTTTLNALVVLGYAILCMCFHWGEVNRGLLYWYFALSLVNSGGWTGLVMLAGSDVAQSQRVADDGRSGAGNV